MRWQAHSGRSPASGLAGLAIASGSRLQPINAGADVRLVLEGVAQVVIFLPYAQIRVVLRRQHRAHHGHGGKTRRWQLLPSRGS